MENYEGLRSCPFCGDNHIGFVGSFSKGSYVCCNCGGAGGYGVAEESAKIKWNTRKHCDLATDALRQIEDCLNIEDAKSFAYYMLAKLGYH